MALDYFVRYEAYLQSAISTPALTLILFSDQTWQNILAHGNFDYIVVGSGFTALAFIQKALELDPCVKILCLERGGKCSGFPC
jgi:hypothetical protein